MTRSEAVAYHASVLGWQEAYKHAAETGKFLHPKTGEILWQSTSENRSAAANYTTLARIAGSVLARIEKKFGPIA